MDKGIITLDTVKNFLESNEDGKKWLQSYADSKVTKGIDTWKTANLQNEINKKVKELYPDEDPKDKELKQIRAELDKIKKDNAKKEVLNDVVKTAAEKKLPVELVKLLVSDDLEKTNSNIKILEDTWNKTLKQSIKGKIESGTPTPGINAGELSKDNFLAMTYQEKKTLKRDNPDIYNSLVKTI